MVVLAERHIGCSLRIKGGLGEWSGAIRNVKGPLSHRIYSLLSIIYYLFSIIYSLFSVFLKEERRNKKGEFFNKIS